MEINFSKIPHIYKALDINTSRLGCVMLDVDGSGVYHEIEQQDLYFSPNPDRHWIRGFVAEKTPHVTLLYGLLHSAQEWRSHVDAVLKGWELKEVEVSHIGYFESPYPDEDYYCIVAHVAITPELLEGHRRLSLLPHINTFPEYKAHITIAYIRKDEELRDKVIERYTQMLEGYVFTVKGLNYGKSFPADESPLATASNRNYSKGIGRIAQERWEQVHKHGWTTQHDSTEHPEGGLLMFALYVLTGSQEYLPATISLSDVSKVREKDLEARIAISGALLAAELDRLDEKNRFEAWVVETFEPKTYTAQDLGIPADGQPIEVYVVKGTDLYAGRDRDDLRWLWNNGIVEQFANASGTGRSANVGYSPSEHKWFGWSHRAFFGFGIGYVVPEGSTLEKHAPGFKAENIEQARGLAVDFANSVS